MPMPLKEMLLRKHWRSAAAFRGEEADNSPASLDRVTPAEDLRSRRGACAAMPSKACGRTPRGGS